MCLNDTNTSICRSKVYYVAGVKYYVVSHTYVSCYSLTGGPHGGAGAAAPAAIVPWGRRRSRRAAWYAARLPTLPIPSGNQAAAHATAELGTVPTDVFVFHAQRVSWISSDDAASRGLETCCQRSGIPGAFQFSQCLSQQETLYGYVMRLVVGYPIVAYCR